MNKKVEKVFNLWGQVLEITKGVGKAHEQYRQFLISHGAALDVSFKGLTDEQAEHDAAVIEKWLEENRAKE